MTIRLLVSIVFLVLGAMPARAGDDAVADALLRAVHPPGQARVELDNPSLHLPSTGFVLDGVTYDARNGRLAAVVASEDGERIRVTGRVRHLVEVPVLTRVVAPLRASSNLRFTVTVTSWPLSEVCRVRAERPKMSPRFPKPRSKR